MLTLREALQMPVFDQAKVVAGHQGLDNEIGWVHIVDIPDAHFEWGRPDILLLTAGFGLRDEPERQTTLIPKLVKEGFSGLVFCTGYYFDRTPPALLEAADRADFPIIETPQELLFIEITEAIFEQIVNRQYVLLQQSAHIHQRLTRLVLQGGNLNNLARTLASLVQRSVSLEDANFRLLAAAQHGPVDRARRRSVSEGRTNPEVARWLRQAGIYEKLLEKMGPVHVPLMPDLGMEMERIVAPIIVDRELYGYIWIIGGEHALTELDELALDHGATVAALIMFKEQAVRRAEETLRGDFFEQLLRGKTDSASLAEQAHRLHYRLDRPHQILVLQQVTTAMEHSRSLAEFVGDWFRCREIPALPVMRPEGLVVLIESRTNAEGKQLAAELVEALNHPARPLLVGVGTVWEAADGSERVRESYEKAREALRVSCTLGQQTGVIAFEDLGLLHWLYHLPASVWNDNVYTRYIHTLAAYDTERNTSLVDTLEVYLDHGGSLVDSAEALYIHRNTLLHRLERIEELCPLTLRDPLQRLNLHVALKSYRLRNGTPPARPSNR